MIATLNKEKRMRQLVWLLVGLAVASVFLTGCNTVRGVAKDVTEAADALDPGQD